MFSSWVLVFPCDFLDPPTMHAFLTLSALWEAILGHPAFPWPLSGLGLWRDVRRVFWSQIAWVQICHPLTLWLWASYLNFLGLLCRIWILVLRHKALSRVVNEVMLGQLFSGVWPFLIPDPWYGSSSLLWTPPFFQALSHPAPRTSPERSPHLSAPLLLSWTVVLFGLVCFVLSQFPNTSESQDICRAGLVSAYF